MTSLTTYGELQFKKAKKFFEEFLEERKERLAPLLDRVPTPSLLVDLRGVKENFRRIKEAFGGFKVFYAVKANDDERILKALAEEGAGFEVASVEELKKVLSAGGKAEKVISSNPVKPEEFVDFAKFVGVDLFAVDSFAEVEKIRRVAPRSRVYVRLAVPNEGSEWPLTRKFGLGVEEALQVLEYSAQLGLVPYGITFHVGSQCNNLQNWFNAVKLSARLWELARGKGIKLFMLNAGGGLPVRYYNEALKPEDVAYYLKGLLRKYFPLTPPELQIEPGRAVVGDQGLMVVKVVGKAKRGEENWLYVDTGVFNGLAEALGGIRYPTYLRREGELKEWTLGGVSCDSMDVIAKGLYLPEPEVGDRLFLLSAGAYTTVYASRFNGFPPPQVITF